MIRVQQNHMKLLKTSINQVLDECIKRKLLDVDKIKKLHALPIK